MPTLTTNLEIKKPLGSELVTRASINENYDIIDAAAIANKGNVKSFQAGADASKPAAGIAGRFFLAVDTQIVYRDTGATWAVFMTNTGSNLITDDVTLSVPSEYADIQAALDYLADKRIVGDAVVTIQVAAGHHSYTDPIIFNHPDGKKIQILGATPVTTTITGHGVVTGSAGNYSVPVTVTDTTGMTAGDYVILKSTTGTAGDDFFSYRGIWEILSVDSGTQITVKNTHRAAAFPTSSLGGGSAVCLTTVLSMTTDGLIIEPGAHLGLLDDLALVGGSGTGMFVGALSTDTDIRGPALAMIGSAFGVNGFSEDGIVVSNCGELAAEFCASCGNGQYGMMVENHSSSKIDTGTFAGNVFEGLFVHNGSTVWISGNASGNGQTGFYAMRLSSLLAAGTSAASGNGQDGFYACASSTIEASNSISQDNGYNGYRAEAGSYIGAGSTTASGNGGSYQDYFAWLGSSMNAIGHVGSPTFSPTEDTVENKNSIISVTTP